MDPTLFILTIVSAVVAGAAVFMPSENRRGHHWDEEDLRDQLGAGH